MRPLPSVSTVSSEAAVPALSTDVMRAFAGATGVTVVLDALGVAVDGGQRRRIFCQRPPPVCWR